MNQKVLEKALKEICNDLEKSEDGLFKMQKQVASLEEKVIAQRNLKFSIERLIELTN